MSEVPDSPGDVLVGLLHSRPFARGKAHAAACETFDLASGESAAPLPMPAASADRLAGRILARALLARRAHCRPSAIRLRHSADGQPEVVAPESARRLRFSVAHADGIALCAVSSNGAIGADIESLRNVGLDPLVLAPEVCTEREARNLRHTTPRRRAEYLLSIWTIKEALAKAVGLGVALSFPHIVIEALRDGIFRVRWRWGAREEHSLWRLRWLRPTSDHIAAIAVHVARGTH